MDTTIKPLYGQREGAVVSDNPKTPGRPSHACHSSMMAGTRLVLDVTVELSNAHTSKHASPSPWALLDRPGREHWADVASGRGGLERRGQHEPGGAGGPSVPLPAADDGEGEAGGGQSDRGRRLGRRGPGLGRAGDGVAALGMEPAASGGGSAPAPARRCGRGGGERRRRPASPGFRRGCRAGAISGNTLFW